MKISVVIITYNEARNIGRCIASLEGIADEIVVLDSYSTDATESICKAVPGLRWVQHAFDGHIEQKNRAVAWATYDWVLSLDADEALSEPLRRTILTLKYEFAQTPDSEAVTASAKRHFNVQKSPTYAPPLAYSMNRRTNYCGQWIAHSGWYPDRKVRLFDRRLAQWGGRNPHDRVVLSAGVREAHLEGDLLHYSYYTVAEHWSRARRYADIAAQAMLEEGRRATWAHLLLSPATKWLRNYVFKLGFLDGRAGWTICRIAAVETYWKYLRLYRLRKAR
jgi:glycosyltransferase involved in cell wall biosynthesis